MDRNRPFDPPFDSSSVGIDVGHGMRFREQKTLCSNFPGDEGESGRPREVETRDLRRRHRRTFEYVYLLQKLVSARRNATRRCPPPRPPAPTPL